MAGPLPFELCDLVIDELRFSFTDLKVCSLVCKAFLPRCRAHLYRILHIGPRRICGIDKERMQSLFEELQNSFTETLQQPDIVSCIQGLCIESRIRDVFYNPPRVVNPSQPQGKAVIKPSISSIDLPFKQLQFLRTHWKFIDSLNDPSDSVSGDVALFEQVLDRIDCLEHLVIEKYWRFHAYRDILRSIAVHAPHLKTLCLSEFRWYPSFSILVLEDIFDEWSSKFASLGITPLRLDRLCLRNFSTKGTDLIQMVVLPSPCLDLRMLRYLAMPASSLEKAFTDERFSELGRELIHLTITDLNTSEFQLRKQLFPKLEQLQLFVKDEWLLLRFLEDFSAHWALEFAELDFHINLETEYRDLIRQNGSGSAPANELAIEESNDTLASSIDPVLQALIIRMSQASGEPRKIYVGMDFIQADGIEMQQKCIKNAFPLSFETGMLHWRERRLLEWWFK